MHLIITETINVEKINAILIIKQFHFSEITAI